MDIYNDTALLGASSPHSPLPLALHEFLGYRAPPVTYSYAHSCDMSIATDERTPSSAASHRVSGPGRSGEGHVQIHMRNQPPHIMGARLEAGVGGEHGQEQQDQPPKGALFVAVSIPPLNWQAMRSQVGPGKNEKAKQTAWIHGWSAAVGALGDKTYCACPDMPMSLGSNPTPPGTPKGKDSLSAKVSRKDGLRGKGDRVASILGSRQAGQLPLPGKVEPCTTSTSTIRSDQSPSLVCRTCSRLPSPAILPAEDSNSFRGSSNKIIQKGKGILKNLVDKFRNRTHGNSAQPPGEKTAIIPAPPHPPLQDDKGEDEDEEIYDINQLSSQSSRKALHRPRPGADIGPRQARLKRAQMLLSKHQSNNEKTMKKEEDEGEVGDEAG